MTPNEIEQLPHGTRVRIEKVQLTGTIKHFGTERIRVGTLIVWDDGVDSYLTDFGDYNEVEVVES